MVRHEVIEFGYDFIPQLSGMKRVLYAKTNFPVAATPGTRVSLDLGHTYLTGVQIQTVCGKYVVLVSNETVYQAIAQSRQSQSRWSYTAGAYLITP